VQEEAWPQPRDPDELHDALLTFVALRADDGDTWSGWFDMLVAQRRAGVLEAEAGTRMWFAAEQLRAIKILYPELTMLVRPIVPAKLERGSVGEDEALVSLLRGHVESLGPFTVDELSRRTSLPRGRVASGLAQLEGAGAVLRGRFRAGSGDDEFCDRRLLARIHRYTLDRLRQEIEPVTAQDYLRFLLRLQHVSPGTQLEGKRGLLEAIAQLQGYEAPAAAWERHILPSRVAGYRSFWLDELCLSGDVTWGRLSVRKPSQTNGTPGSATSTTLIAIARRGDLSWLMAGIRNGETPDVPERGAAAEVLALLQARGALFYDDVAAELRRLPTDVERGLWDLVARGLVTADGFQALRTLMAPPRRRGLRNREAAADRRALSSAVPSGRWALLPSPSHDAVPIDELADAWAEQLLFRYGVVFRDAVQRENLSVPWREVLRSLRRMEARGTVRGGRFVAGFYGEQYARPDALESLRKVRRVPRDGEQVHVNAVDPLNLAGILTPGPRIPAMHTSLVTIQDGVPALAPAGRP
jgi:ATP-dependent Lhr-like helicase